MSTGTIQTPSKTIFKTSNGSAIRQTFTADGDLVQGQAVKLTGNGIVAVVENDTDKSVGVVEVGGLDGEKITVLVTAYVADQLVANASGGSIAAGTLVKFKGTLNADNISEVDACVEGDMAQGIVLSGGADEAEMRIGVLHGLFVTPAIVS